MSPYSHHMFSLITLIHKEREMCGDGGGGGNDNGSTYGECVSDVAAGAAEGAVTGAAFGAVAGAAVPGMNAGPTAAGGAMDPILTTAAGTPRLI